MCLFQNKAMISFNQREFRKKWQKSSTEMSKKVFRKPKISILEIIFFSKQWSTWAHKNDFRHFSAELVLVKIDWKTKNFTFLYIHNLEISSWKLFLFWQKKLSILEDMMQPSTSSPGMYLAILFLFYFSKLQSGFAFSKSLLIILSQTRRGKKKKGKKILSPKKIFFYDLYLF